MKSIISFYSYKGGTGRTTTAANVAYQLALMENNVLCIDLDIDGPGLFTVMGIENESELEEKNIVRYFADEGSPDYKDFIHDLSEFYSVKSKFDIIPATMSINREDALETMGSTLPDKFEGLITKAKEDYDYIILDTASGVSDYSVLAFSVSNQISVCFKWSKQHVLGTLRVSKLLKKINDLEQYPLEKWWLIPTSVSPANSEYEKNRKEDVIRVVKENLAKDIDLEISEDPRQKWEEGIITKRDLLFDQYRALANKLIE